MPIPWPAIAQYADRLGMPPLAAESFVEVIVALDRKHREWHREEEDRRASKERRRAARAEKRRARAPGGRRG